MRHDNRGRTSTASRWALASALLLIGCTEDNDPITTQVSVGPASAANASNPDPGDDPDPGDPPDSTTGVDPTGGEPTTGDPGTGLPAARVCELYLDCLSVVSPGELPAAQQGFGPDGTCWQGSPASAEQCAIACETALQKLHSAYSEEPKCGLCQEDSDCLDGGKCNVGECRAPGCGDGIVADNEICDGPDCFPDCQGPLECNPVSQHGCDETSVCFFGGDPLCYPPDGFETLPGDGNACDFPALCKPGLVCTPPGLIEGCPEAGCCTRLCNVQTDETCPGGRVCVPIATTGVEYYEPLLETYVGVCVLP